MQKHGESLTRLHKIYRAMRSRCTSKVPHPNYNGRGITLCHSWQENYFNFKHWAIANGYDSTKTLDRENNDKGYFPGNCRWVDDVISMRNRRKMKSNTSGYIGVNPTPTGKWNAQININKKRLHLGTFKTALEAARARDTYIIENNLESFTLNLK